MQNKTASAASENNLKFFLRFASERTMTDSGGAVVGLARPAT
jgi:hypothetical protein